MKNIVKYVFIFFGLLFLSSFFAVEKTYGYIICDEVSCPSSCECGCQYASGCPTSTCKQCTCPASCSCGCINAHSKQCTDPTHPTSCACGEYRSSICTYSCNHCSDYAGGTCDCGWASDGSCLDKNISSCPLGGNQCTGECTSAASCTAYTCDPGYTAVWDSSQEKCVCTKDPATTCGTGYTPCGGTTANPTCCPPGTYCGQTTSGSKICVAYGDPTPPTENTAPTSPTSLQTEGTSNPQTVTDTTPEFSAIFNDPDTGDTSNYYQIQVNTNSSFTGTVMWNSNKTSMTSTSNGSRSPQISYAGSTLTLNGSTYYWRIKFWDVGGLESPWSSTANFKMCTNVDCNPPQYCEDAGWSPVPLTSESILLEDVVKCSAVINCESVTQYGDCYEDPGIECTKDTDCDTGECCRGYTCTTDCTPVVLCTTDSECGADKCCTGGECGKCLTPDTQSLRVIMGSKISDTIVTSLWDRILAVLRKLNTYMY